MFECVPIAQSWPVARVLLCPLSCLRSDWELCADILARQPMRFRSCTGMSEIGSRSWPSSSLSCRSRSQTLRLLLVVVDVVCARGWFPSDTSDAPYETDAICIFRPRRRCCGKEAGALSSSASSFTDFSTDEQRKRQKNLIIP